VTAFEALCRRYPDAFVSLVSIPGLGTWLGASPELLLSLSDNNLSTVALAGTQGYSDNIPLSAVTWGTKEIEEQALVSEYIRDFFRRLELPRFAEIGPRTVAAGNVAHLQTTFEIDLEPRRLLRLANQVLHDLHPTSAVCGMPKREALSFILENEKYDRAFYSGFLGPVHVENRSQLFVNLRCMQLKQEHAILYVGGGITQDSVPEAEWEETVLKSNTLLAILQPELALAG
jgi:isochorismate synthase